MAEVEKPIKNLDQEVRDMISNLINRLSQVQRSQKHAASSTTQPQEHSDDDDQGLGIITLAGNNTGATMRGEMNETNPQNLGPKTDNNEDFATYVNSNFQAINNSIMLGGSYKTNDPGVHLDVSDYVESNHEARKVVKKGNNKYGSSKSEFRSDDDVSSSD